MIFVLSCFKDNKVKKVILYLTLISFSFGSYSQGKESFENLSGTRVFYQAEKESIDVDNQEKLNVAPSSVISELIFWSLAGVGSYLAYSPFMYLYAQYFDPNGKKLSEIQEGLANVQYNQQKILDKLDKFYGDYIKNTYLDQVEKYNIAKNGVLAYFNTVQNIFQEKQFKDEKDFNNLSNYTINKYKEYFINQVYTKSELEKLEQYADALSGVGVPTKKNIQDSPVLARLFDSLFQNAVTSKAIFFPELQPVTNYQPAINEWLEKLTQKDQDPNPLYTQTNEENLKRYNIFANKIFYDSMVDILVFNTGQLYEYIYKLELFALYLKFQKGFYQINLPSLVNPKDFADGKKQLDKLFKNRSENLLKIGTETKNKYDLNKYIKGEWFKQISGINKYSDINQFVLNKDFPVLIFDKDGKFIRNNIYSNSLFLRVTNKNAKDNYTNIKACKNLTLQYSDKAFQCNNTYDNLNYLFVDFENNGYSNFSYDYDYILKDNLDAKLNIISKSTDGTNVYPISINTQIPALSVKHKNAKYAHLLTFEGSMFYFFNTEGRLWNNIGVGCIKYDNNCLIKYEYEDYRYQYEITTVTFQRFFFKSKENYNSFYFGGKSFFINCPKCYSK